MIDPIWLALLSGALLGASVMAIVLWLVPALREWWADRKADKKGSIEVIDLAAARLQRSLRDDLRRARGRR